MKKNKKITFTDILDAKFNHKKVRHRAMSYHDYLVSRLNNSVVSDYINNIEEKTKE